jgi:hypothetical protein
MNPYQRQKAVHTIKNTSQTRTGARPFYFSSFP